jgi:hypothetical protein
VTGPLVGPVAGPVTAALIEAPGGGWPWALVAVGAAGFTAAVGFLAGRHVGAGEERAWPVAAMGSTPPPGDAGPDGGLDGVVDGVIAAYDLAAGSEAVRAQLELALRAGGVQRIMAAPGSAFDPTRHHVVATEPVAAGGVDRCVAREIRPGWQIGARVVRPAEVVVWTTQ